MQQINDNFQLYAPKSLDNKYTKVIAGNSVPYASTTEANDSIDSAYRSIGLTVLIDVGAENKEYWYKDGIENSDLVVKGTSDQTWQQTLDTGSILDKDNTIDGGGFNISWDDTTHLINTTDDNAKVNIGIGTDEQALRILNSRIPSSILRIWDNSAAGSGANAATHVTLTDSSGTTLFNLNGRAATFSYGSAASAVFQDSGLYMGGSSASNGTYIGNRSMIYAGGSYTWQTAASTQTSGTIRMTLTSTGDISLGTTSAPAASALLDLVSTTKVVLLPRMTKVQRDAITTVAGAVIYQTDNTPGLRVYNGTSWMKFTETAD